jgi:hypothetical protein
VNACVKTGATVHMVAHDLVFQADLFEIAGAMVVRANGRLVPGQNCEYSGDWKWTAPTHILSDRPIAGFWRDDLGIFVVPKNQLTRVGENNG